MRVKLFSLAVNTPIQSLENDINEFLESQRPHVTHVSVSSSDIERIASVWYEEPHHRTVEQTMAELEELVEEPGAEGNLACARAGKSCAIGPPRKRGGGPKANLIPPFICRWSLGRREPILAACPPIERAPSQSAPSPGDDPKWRRKRLKRLDSDSRMAGAASPSSLGEKVDARNARPDESGRSRNGTNAPAAGGVSAAPRASRSAWRQRR